MGSTAGTNSNIHDADRAILADALRAKFGVAFQQFEDAEFELLVLGPREILFEEGDQGTDVYVVLGGRLRAFRRTSKGTEIFNEIGRGETVGELAFLLNAPRSASVMAIWEHVSPVQPRGLRVAAVAQASIGYRDHAPRH